jgi:hypothetical protein
MNRLALTLTLGLVAGSTLIATPDASHAQPTDSCNGQWLWQITFDGRDGIEEAIADFEEDGDLVVYSPPVVPALPGTGDDEALYVSNSVGSWQEASEAGMTCTFSAVRLLATDDGGNLGKVFLQGSVQVFADGTGMEGTFTFDQSAGTGKTVNSGTGSVIGTSTGN